MSDSNLARRCAVHETLAMRSNTWTVGLMLSCVSLGAAGSPRVGESSELSVQAPQALAKKTPPTKLEPFLGTLEEAQKEATERNVPLVIFAVMESEEANDRFAKNVPHDVAIAGALDGTVLVIANAGKHEAKKVEEIVNGKRVAHEVCSVFGTPTCVDHQRNWDPVFLAYNVKGELQCPVVMLVGPDKKVAKRLAAGDVPKAASITSALNALREKIGPGLSHVELTVVKQKLAEAQKSIDAGDAAGAWRSFAAVIAVNDKVRFADEARAGEAKALESLNAQRDDANAKLASDKPEIGYEALLDLATRCKGLPNEKELAKLIQQAETAPATKAAIAQWKREKAALDLWNEMKSLEAAKQAAKAEAKIRQILRKFADTAIGARTKREYPDIAKDEETKGGK